MKVPAFFKNKYVLYVLVLVAIVNILGYISFEDYNSMALFVVMVLLSGYFSKNIALNIFIAILVTGVNSLNNRVYEGFKGKEGVGDSVQSKVKKTETKIDEEEKVEKDDSPKCGAGEKMENGKCVKKSGFQNNVPPSKPASVNNSEDEEIDVAAQMQDAYGNLNKLLGDGAMKSMASETKKLVAQQQNLMNTLSEMTPSLNKAKETLDNLKLPNMEEMVGLMKKFQ
tara:strand:+ start:694 stop:1371 length:678 start_codon:yes stop_codon:yes gene_type:complete